MTGQSLIETAEKHIGEQYVFGIVVPKNDSNWNGPWDCAEFGSYCVYQVSQRLYGCFGTRPETADAYTGKWGDDSNNVGIRIPVNEAATIPGAFVLRVGTKVGHLVMSDGKGGTIEAQSSSTGVVQNTLHRRRWKTGALIPWIKYEAGSTSDVNPPPIIYRLTIPYMIRDKVWEIQIALRDRGYYEDEIDGIFGPRTHNAVVRFQEVNGLVIDGEVGPQTARSLRITL